MNLGIFIITLIGHVGFVWGVTSPWGWRCEGLVEPAKCVKERNTPGTGLTNLETCKLTCGPYGALFPRPKQVTLGNTVSYFEPTQIILQELKCPHNVRSLLNEAFQIFNASLPKYNPDDDIATLHSHHHGVGRDMDDHWVLLYIHVIGSEETLSLSTDEAYTLKVQTQGNSTTVLINAPTFFGARHALETLSQLIEFEEITTKCLQIIQSAEIADEPAFPYRGVIIDTARNFIPVESLKRNIDAMSYSKLNTFHWHITDSQSFPLKLNVLSNMSLFGAYSYRQVYTSEDVKEIVRYAKVRGIRVLPELDAPGHVGQGWQWGEEAGLGKLVVCLDKQPWTSYCAGPPCGQLNIANSNIYEVLLGIYTEMIEMFGPIDLFHYGGDEIFINCWNSSSEIVDWMTENLNTLDADSYYNQWGVFQERARNLLTQANINKEVLGILWTSDLTEAGRIDKYLDKNKYIIQIWSIGDDPVIADLLKSGYRVIFSNRDALYLDCGFASWIGKGNNWCSPYKGWQDAYDNDILALSRAANITGVHDDQVLGGEAAAWSEQIDGNTLDAKLWPRSAALAERLWSNPAEDYSKAEPRMLQHRDRLVKRGIAAERLQPEWCRQNSGECRLP